MKAMILAAGLGTRLKPWTLEHPKALVPVGGVPMLRRVIEKLRDSGFDRITVNVHHFADQVKEYLSTNDFGVCVTVSDESDLLLDTGGGILGAADLLFADDEPVLIHNVDILSDADLQKLMETHKDSGSEATLLVSDRESSRRLIFDEEGRLCGWHNSNTGEYRPAGFVPAEGMKAHAFSGIHVVSRSLIYRMKRAGLSGAFPIMDFYLGNCGDADYRAYLEPQLHLIDIGKPQTLAEANLRFSETEK